MSSDSRAYDPNITSRLSAVELAACTEIVIANHATTAVDALQRLYVQLHRKVQRPKPPRIPLQELFDKSPHLAILMASETGRSALVQGLIDADKLSHDDINRFSIF